MAQSLKRTKTEARSASAPPGFAECGVSKNRRRSTLPESKGPWPNGNGESNRSSETATPVSSTGGSQNSASVLSTAGSRTPQQKHAEANLNSDDDFVQGGIELPPAPERGGGERGLSGDGTTGKTPTRPLPSLDERQLEEFWPAGKGPRALFLDYDGTLREFENRPEQAVPTPEIEELLQAINGRKDLVPHIISGRDAKFLGTYFGSLERFTLIAEHGFQIWRPGKPGWELWDHPDGLDKDHDDWKAIVHSAMTDFVHATPGSHVEEKASSLVWHYREVEDAVRGEEAASRAMEKLEELRSRNNIHKIRISHGHKVVEVSYRKVRKGPVMRRICEEKALFGEPFLSVLVAGDDTSDESMFDIAPDDFLTIKVGPAETHAKFRVDSPELLRKFLWQLIS
mmetsp:Transcript_46110/g.103691  ORF Transcript_46110/g.103691 Transcript_46110/m.103691 type:complete len:398 (+) Transcript_46110:99-1292(+)